MKYVKKRRRKTKLPLFIFSSQPYICMKKEDLEKIRKYLDIGAVIRCQDILKLESTANSRAFDLVDIKNRDYICRIYSLSDIYEIIREFTNFDDFQKELYRYYIHTLYKQSRVKFSEMFESQRSSYDLYYVIPENIVDEIYLNHYKFNFQNEFYRQVYKKLENVYKQESIRYFNSSHNNIKVEISYELVGGNFVCCNCIDKLHHPIYTTRENLVYIKKNILN